MKLLTVVGARPQFIKAAALSRSISERSDIEEIIVHTGQHFDENMSDIFFSQMGIPQPNYRFNINGLNHGAMTGQMLEAIEKVILNEKPDYLLVYGDTNSTLAGALAAKKLHVKVAHVEAGLRSFNMDMPEEVNRILTDRISDWLFCPTETAMDNLKKEGFENFGVHMANTGDIMFDSMLLFQQFTGKFAGISKEYEGEEFVLCTIHRAENTDDPEKLNAVIKALNIVAENYTVLLPLHPRTRSRLDGLGIKPNAVVTDPLGYFDMLNLLKHCKMVLTDSGGLQKEAYFSGKYCVTLREETEWTELTRHNYNILAGTSTQKIVDAVNILQNKPFENRHSFYGDGNCSRQVLRYLTGS